MEAISVFKQTCKSSVQSIFRFSSQPQLLETTRPVSWRLKGTATGTALLECQAGSQISPCEYQPAVSPCLIFSSASACKVFPLRFFWLQVLCKLCKYCVKMSGSGQLCKLRALQPPELSLSSCSL